MICIFVPNLYIGSLCSYNRINNLLSSVGGKLSLATTIKYVEYCEEAWLLLRLRNYASALADKESNCKYYFVDTGINQRQAWHHRGDASVEMDIRG